MIYRYADDMHSQANDDIPPLADLAIPQSRRA